MTNGLAARVCRVSLIFGLLWTLFPLPSPARPSASAQGVSVTILAIGAHTVQVMGEDGRTEMLAIGPTSAFLRQGMLVRAGEFLAGEKALLRRHVGKGGAAQVGLLCDLDSAAAQEKYRCRPLTGMLLSLSPSVWVVQPAEGLDSVPLSLLVSAQSSFTAGNAPVTAAAFGPGASVTVTTRGLPSGLLSITSASDAAGSEEMPPAPAHRAEFVSGIVTDIQSSAITIQDKTNASHTIAADGATRIKVRRQPATLAEIAVGMHLSAWLGHREDAAGNPIATTLSVYDAAHKAGKKIR